ncbi:hypothetical protein SKAU_G00280240 [Synaphobranchus kaupii]|uniref:SCAN box domain-containing protein n=1 Tax=Synaphobranchus kaupii TaxID=118154 RepID=A0A9Q1EWV4_SYNKA|nr:hypothetical protein SKAU_G00280240 [Synaphobranchus kaupii]
MPGQDELESVEEAVSLFPARRQFRHLTKEQLEGLAEEHEVTVPDNTKKPALIKLLMAELELEDIWAGEEKREAREAEQAEREAEQAEREAERSSRIQLAKLEVERAKAVHGPALTSRFDVSQARHFMPKFREEDADTFFEAFEIVAREMEWPDAKWALLVQSSLAGKAQVAFAALDPRVGLNYEELKKAVLAAYGGVPESYRQRFRNLKRRNGESYLDVGRRLSIAFDRWLAAGKVFDYSELRELMLVEQFKNSVPREVEVYLSERQVNKLVEASQMADAFEVIHAEPSGKSRPNGGRHDGHRNKEVTGGDSCVEEFPSISEEVVVCPDSVTPPAGVPEPGAPPVDLEESVELADTVFARAVGMSEPSHFTREALVREQHQDGTLAALWKEAVTEEESQDVAAGVYVQDDVLMLVSPQSEDEGENLYTPPEPVSARVENTRALEQLGKQLSHLTTVQRQDVLELVASHPVLFKDRPGLTPLAIHDVETASMVGIQSEWAERPVHCLGEFVWGRLNSLGSGVRAWPYAVPWGSFPGQSNFLCNGDRSVRSFLFHNPLQSHCFLEVLVPLLAENMQLLL